MSTYKIGLFNESTGKISRLFGLIESSQIPQLILAVEQIAAELSQPPAELTARKLFQSYRAFLSKYGEEGAKAFSDYYAEFSSQNFRFSGSEARLDPETGMPIPKISPEQFDPDIKTFIGALLLSNSIFAPSEAQTICDAMDWISMVAERHPNHDQLLLNDMTLPYVEMFFSIGSAAQDAMTYGKPLACLEQDISEDYEESEEEPLPLDQEWMKEVVARMDPEEIGELEREMELSEEDSDNEYEIDEDDDEYIVDEDDDEYIVDEEDTDSGDEEDEGREE